MAVLAWLPRQHPRARAPVRVRMGTRVSPPLRLFRFLGSHEGTTARADAAHLDDHSIAHLDKMRKVGGLRVEASGRQCFEQGGICLLAIPCVPGAGQDRNLTRVWMRVRGELVASGEFQADCVGTGLAGIAHKADLLKSGQSETTL